MSALTQLVGHHVDHAHEMERLVAELQSLARHPGIAAHNREACLRRAHRAGRAAEAAYVRALEGLCRWVRS